MGMDDLMARSAAAGSMAVPGMAGAEPEMAMPEPEPALEEGGDIEAGASIIEAVADTMDPATGDQIRQLLNQIRELAAGSVPPEEGAPPGPPMDEPLAEGGAEMPLP